DGIRDFHVTGVQTCALPIFDRIPGSRCPRIAALASMVLLVACGREPTPDAAGEAASVPPPQPTAFAPPVGADTDAPAAGSDTIGDRKSVVQGESVDRGGPPR